MRSLLHVFTALALGVSSGSASAALTITLNGQGVYDSDLNITWLRDANLARTNTFGVFGIGVNGMMYWNKAQSWIDGMNAANYLGFNDWRLPTMTDTGTPGCNWSYSGGTDCGYNSSTGELAHLYYSELGNLGAWGGTGSLQPGGGLTNTGPFINLQPNHDYLYGTDYAPNISQVWRFHAGLGLQAPVQKYTTEGYTVWAVRSGGNPAAVPEPETYAMLFAGLGLLGYTARRRKRNA